MIPPRLPSLAALAVSLLATCVAQERPVYLDPTATVEARVEDLLPRLTLDEKLGLIHGATKFTNAGVPRLGLPPLHMSDGPHGVREEISPNSWEPSGRTDDFSTYLPVAIALASTWNPELANAYGQTIADEARQRGKDVMLGPGVNIMRTPLNGRNFEYFGEDPWLTSRIAVGYIQGMQAGNVASCVKHYALNNQEIERGTIDVEVDDRALHEIYLPAFESAVKEAHVLTVMGAYNRYRGQHLCHNELLVNQVLKGDWGFRGVYLSDWGGVHDTREAAQYGMDLEMGTQGLPENNYLAAPFKALLEAGQLPTTLLDDKVRRILRVVFTLKLTEGRPNGSINTAAHQLVARKVADEALVLLKNENNALPLNLSEIKSIAVIGENAVRKQAHGGWSSELKAFYEVVPLEGLVHQVGSSANLTFAHGYKAPVVRRLQEVDAAGVRKVRTERIPSEPKDVLIARAVQAAKQADVAIVFAGMNHETNLDTEGSDKTSLRLPYDQDELISRVLDANPRTIVVIMAGGPVEMDPWLSRVPAVLQAWYPGMEGGNAIAAALFGEVNPSGKLPCTFPRKLADSPAHSGDGEVYPGTGKNGIVRYREGLLVGYRWFDTKKIEPLFPFGFGLSYTRFALTAASVRENPQDENAWLTVECDVMNTGDRAGAETVQVYVSDPTASVSRPAKELKGFAKVLLQPGEKKRVSIPLRLRALAFYSPDEKAWVAEKGEFSLQVGTSSRQISQTLNYTLAATRKLKVDAP